MREREPGKKEAGRAASVPPSAASRDAAAHEDFLFHLYRGSELLQDNRVMEAKEELEQALTLQPRDAKGQDLLAVVYFRIGLYPRAIHIYEELRRANPNDVALLLNLALCYLKTGQALAAKKELEALLKIQPNHRRALGYLGLSLERLGDYDSALAAFESGGHQAMARRVSEKVGRSGTDPGTGTAAVPSSEERAGEARDAVAEAFSELDAGELSFALAEPITGDYAGQQWAAVELGRPGSAPPTSAASMPKLGNAAQTQGRRAPTLMVGLAAPPPPSNVTAALPTAGEPARPDGPPSGVLPTLAMLGASVAVNFPATPSVIRRGGLILARTDAGHSQQDERAFAVRMDAVRALSSGLAAAVLERQQRGVSTGEAFGGLGRPLSRVRGTGEICVGPRPGYTLTPFRLADDSVFLREEVLLGFELTLSFENGRLTTDDGDATPFVQLKGTGVAVIETLGALSSIELGASRSIHVRRETIVGWSGRLVPRAVGASDAPSGQRGLVSFAGEGTVLLVLR